MMRILVGLLALPLFALSAQAGTTAHKRLTMEQRFEQANITHDGHLTEEQAKAEYRTVARHFAAIDKDKKGYVTEDDIRAYNKTQHAVRHQPATSHRPPSG